MADMSSPAALWAAKTAGAIAGSAISLAYILPRGRREAALRFVVGIVSGLVFGGVAGLKLAAELGLSEHMSTSEIMLSGAALASLCAWWAVGFAVRFFSHGDRQPGWGSAWRMSVSSP